MMKPYETYKDSDVEWIGEIPEHWESIRMKFIGSLYSGLSGKKGDDFRREESEFNQYYIPFTNIANNTVIDPNRLDTVEIFEDENQNGVQKNDLFFLMSSENYEDIGKTAVLRVELENTFLNSFCKGFRLFDQTEVDANFLNYLLAGDIYRKILSIEAKGFTRINLQMGKIQNLPVILPNTKSEQTQIANYLDHKTSLIDNIIAQKEQLIEKLKEQRQAVINESITKGLNPEIPLKDSIIDWVDKIPANWNEKKIRYVFEIVKNISGELGYDVLSVTQRGLKVKDITNYKGQFSMDYSKYQIVEEGDFVMNHMDLLTGYVDISKQVGVTSPDYRVFRQIKDDIEPEYFLYLFQMAYKQKIFYSYGQGVSQLGRWRLPATAFKNIVIPFPDKKEQKQIVEFLDMKIGFLNKSIGEIEEIIEKLKEYRQSVISEAVTGKVDVRDWKPKTA